MKTIYPLLVTMLALAGCANPAAQAPDTFDAAAYEPVCARQCLGQYSICTGNVGSTGNRLIAGDVLQACQSNTRQCLSTCPPK